MNNANISRYFDESSEKEEAEVKAKQLEFLQKRASDLTILMENLRAIGQSEQWRSLKEKYFDGLKENLERELLEEATKDSPDVLKLSKINGQLMWARRYADLNEFANTMRVELLGIKQLLYGTTQD